MRDFSSSLSVLSIRKLGLSRSVVKFRIPAALPVIPAIPVVSPASVVPGRLLRLGGIVARFNQPGQIHHPGLHYENLGGPDVGQADPRTVEADHKMKYKENCIFKQGWFPETANGLEETFVFVSIDCDLFDPILEGLRYFYPRLARGGYIFVHEYNYSRFAGAKGAVKQFLAEEPDVRFFPLTDQNGTMVFIK
jgi:O-methyltransferase